MSDSRDNTKYDAEDGRYCRSADSQANGIGKAPAKFIRYRLAGLNRSTEIALGKFCYELFILHRQRLVQAKPFTFRFNLRMRGRCAQQGSCRISRNETYYGKYHNCEHQQHDDQLNQALDRIFQHLYTTLTFWLKTTSTDPYPEHRHCI